MKTEKSTYSGTNTIGISEVASILHVSGATVRNWLKSNYLPSHKKEGKQVFYLKEIQAFQTQLQSEKSLKLKNRANKTNSEKSFFPTEYLKNKTQLQDFKTIIAFIQMHSISTSTALLLLSLNLLYKEKMMQTFTFEDVLNQKLRFKNKYIKNEIRDWFSSLQACSLENNYSFLLHCDVPQQQDLLGFVYQSLMKEGTKSQSGAYYTPENIVNDIVSAYVKSDSKVLDPCCGTGQFLLAFAQTISDPTFIYGIDNDETAVRIARLNLIMAYKNHDFNPNIVCKNTLFDTIPFQDFDLIASNPPWGFHFSTSEKQTIKKLYPEITSMESFSLFFKKSLDLIHKKGTISFILPESILFVKTHRDIRTLILKQTHILQINYLNRVFKNVFSPIIRLDLIKDASIQQATTIRYGCNLNSVDTSTWHLNTDNVFPVFSTDYDKQLLDKIYALPHTNLYKQASWALGIVTGNNYAYLSNSPKAEYKPVYKGSDILPFGFKNASHYLKFVPDKFQQIAPLEKYQADEKLIYRFISNRLIFSYDNMQRLTLNSANCLIPTIPNYSMKIIALLFNSSLYQYIFQKKFGSIKVLRSQLEELPLPFFDDKSYQQMKHLYNRISKEKNNQKGIDDYIMTLFGLTAEEQLHIFKSLK